jgi:hypothetical protein
VNPKSFVYDILTSNNNLKGLVIMRRLKQTAILSLILVSLMAGCAKKESTKTTHTDSITDDQAIYAIKNYCHINNPDLADIEKAGEYPVYWEISSSDDKEIVVLFRSYTGAQNRYYIDPLSGDTYVTEFVPGITSEEERTEESFNVRDYLSK